jgi:hypothetical protein
MNETLIEKYYKGETSLEEENELRIAFSSEEAKNNDHCTQLIFNAFAEEKAQIIPSTVKLFSPTNKVSTKFSFYCKKWVSITSGAVACLLLVFGLLFYKHTQANNAYVIINGVRINDEKLALQYIIESFEEEERINEIAKTQLQEMERIENELNEIANNILNN